MNEVYSTIVAQKLGTWISENEDFSKRPGQNRFFAAYQVREAFTNRYVLLSRRFCTNKGGENCGALQT